MIPTNEQMNAAHRFYVHNLEHPEKCTPNQKYHALECGLLGTFIAQRERAAARDTLTALAEMSGPLPEDL